MTCADKQRKVCNNDEISKEAFAIMFKEFDIGRRLDHPGIIKTMHFLKLSQYSRSKSGYDNEFHMFIEYMEGGNL